MSENIGKIIVLDIETAPDPYLLSFAPSRLSKDHPSLHAVTGYSILAAEEDQNGDWSVTDLASPQNTDEYEILFELDEMVTPAIEQEATLVTYNGISHDVLMIQRRMGAHMLYALPSQSGLARMKHRDMMREVSTGPRNWPSLQQLCAIYSIPSNHLLIPSRGPIAPTHERKSQVDVIATYLILAHRLAGERGSSAVVGKAWLALASFLNDKGKVNPHLAQFLDKDLLARARAQLGDEG